MCLIIARRRGADPIPEDYIKNALIHNSDGFGIVGKDHHTGQVSVHRDLHNKNVAETIRIFEEYDAEFLAHFRYATHGTVSLDNVHPFELKNNAFMVHNGTVSVKEYNKVRSDTWHLAQDIKLRNVKMSSRNLLRYLNKRTKYLNGSRFAFIGKELPLTIFNEKSGFTEKGVWYSNKYSVEGVTKTRYYGGIGGYGSYRDYLAEEHYLIGDKDSSKSKNEKEVETLLLQASEEEEGTLNPFEGVNDEYSKEFIWIEDALIRGYLKLSDLATTPRAVISALCYAYPEDMAETISYEVHV